MTVFAMGAARHAAAHAMARFSAPPEEKRIEFKGPTDLVTAADRETERILAEAVKERYLDHAFLGEEGGGTPGTEFRWIVDPIDGTTNFAHGLSWFALSIALERRGTVVAGVVFHPAANELFVAQKGNGAYVVDSGGWNRLAVSRTDALTLALMGAGLPNTGDRAQWSPFLCRFAGLTQEIRVMGSAALHLAYVAAGRLDGFVEPALEVWDVAAGILLVEEAGGRVTDFDGQPPLVASGDVAASNGRLHSSILEVLRPRQ